MYEVTSRYLEDISKLAGNTPIALAEFILPKFHIAICSNGVDCCDVVNSKVEHVEGRIPMCSNIARHHIFSLVKIAKDRKPMWKKDGCRVLDCEFDLLQLWKSKSEK